MLTNFETKQIRLWKISIQTIHKIEITSSEFNEQTEL